MGCRRNVLIKIKNQRLSCEITGGRVHVAGIVNLRKKTRNCPQPQRFARTPVTPPILFSTALAHRLQKHPNELDSECF
jgi:hypothetical protein